MSGARLDPGLALIFDMDGVIVDSNPYHRRAWVLYNRRHGLETTEEMLEWMYGKHNREIVRHYYGDSLSPDEVDAHGAAKEALYREMVAGELEQALVPGVREFLEQYGSCPIAVASNAEGANVDFILDRAGLRHYFDVVVAGHQVANPKPHPEVYQTAARRLGVSTANCIVFEDSYSGIEAATLAGMRIVGVQTTHFRLPNTDCDIDNFCNGNLQSWLLSQKSV